MCCIHWEWDSFWILKPKVMWLKSCSGQSRGALEADSLLVSYMRCAARLRSSLRYAVRTSPSKCSSSRLALCAAVW